MLEETIKLGDRIRIIGKINSNIGRPLIDFTQPVTSMQIEHQKIEQANPGDLIGLQVDEKVCKGCEVFKL